MFYFSLYDTTFNQIFKENECSTQIYAASRLSFSFIYKKSVMQRKGLVRGMEGWLISDAMEVQI